MKKYVLVKGTTVKVNGVPIILQNDTIILTETALEKDNETRKLIYPRKDKNK